MCCHAPVNDMLISVEHVRQTGVSKGIVVLEINDDYYGKFSPLNCPNFFCGIVHVSIHWLLVQAMAHAPFPNLDALFAGEVMS